MTIKQILVKATKDLLKTSTSPQLDAEVLLAFVFKKERAWLFAHLDKKLNKRNIARFQKLIRQRKKYEPVAYIIKNKEFYGLDFCVDRRVLIPRPETELLVEEVIKNVKLKKLSHSKSAKNQKLKIADIGTGSGCIAVALAKNLAGTMIYATDISKAALKIAKKNIKKHKVKSRVKLLHGDLLSPLKNKKVDIICANLPYLITKQLKVLEKDIKLYQPKVSLLAGKSETDLYERLIKQSPKYLKKNGLIFLEINPSFKNKIIKIINKHFTDAQIKIIKDLSLTDRLVEIKI